MLFIVSETALKPFIEPKQTYKNIIELDAEAYKNMMLKMYDLHKRVQHLELQEWKQNNKWFQNLFNISTTYETIDKIFEIKNEASIEDFGDVLIGYNYITPNNYIIKNTSVCMKSYHKVNYDCKSHYIGNEGDRFSSKYETRCESKEFPTYSEAYKFYSEQEPKDTPPNSRGENYISVGDKGFSFNLCSESIPINETNIIGYINYKHAYNTNDEKWLIEQIKQIINDNKGLYFEDYVKLFRDGFYRINEDDERLYKLIRQEMKTYEDEHKKVKLW